MNPEVIEKYETGSKKVEVNLVTWSGLDLGIQIRDTAGNFTSFSVRDKMEGTMKGHFLASMFRVVQKRKPACKKKKSR